MSNQSFEFWQHKERVRQIAEIENGQMVDVLWSADVSVNLPVLAPTLILQYRVGNNQALVITRFEAFLYDPTQPFPLQSVFDNSMVMQFSTAANIGLNPNKLRFGGLANSIANTDPIFLFNSGEVGQLNIIDVAGPRLVNIVATCYAWLIPGGKAANFENYKTQQASV